MGHGNVPESSLREIEKEAVNTKPITSFGEKKPNEYLAYIAWTIALIATVGSLFFSEVMDFAPCVLCWYQRIAIYPLVLVIGVGIILRDRLLKYYALPLCFGGLAVAIYHNLLYYGVIPESISPCREGVSCKDVQIELFGFITIPLMSFVAFVLMSLCLFFYNPKEKVSYEQRG